MSRASKIDKTAADMAATEAPGSQRSMWQETWRRFKKNKLAMAGLSFLLLLVVIAVATLVIDLVTGKDIYNNYGQKQKCFRYKTRK